MKYLYKYPQAAFPYADLVQTNRNRSKQEGEYELLDTGLFQNSKYFDVFTEYAKNDPEDLCIRITRHNRSDEPGYIALLPTLWMRNLWSFGIESKSSITRKETRSGVGSADISHPLLGNYYFYFEEPQRALLTENETNTEKLYGQPNKSEFVKDAFHDAIIHKKNVELPENKRGNQIFAGLSCRIAPGATKTYYLRLSDTLLGAPFTSNENHIFARRKKEADEFYDAILPYHGSPDLTNDTKPGLARLVWSKQYYHYDIERVDEQRRWYYPHHEGRKTGRNHQWQHLKNQDIISHAG